MRYLFLVFYGLFTVSCVSHRCPARLYNDAFTALSDNSNTRRQVIAIRAEASVDQRGTKGRVRGVVLMFAARPNRVRLDAMTQFGPAAILTADAGLFAFTDFRENRYLEGKTCPSNIARLLGINLSSEHATALLLGETPLIEASKSEIRCTSEGNYSVSLRAADGHRQQITFTVAESDLDKPPGKQGLLLAQTELVAPSGKVIWRFTYDDYRMVAHAGLKTPMPFSVRIEQPAFKTDTLLRFRQIAINPAIPPGAFVQKAPPGMQRQIVSCD